MRKFKSGKITLLNCDCMDYMSGQLEKSFDLAVVDPPYFNGPQIPGYYGTGRSDIGILRENSYAVPGSWDVPDENYFQKLFEISKNQIIWGANHFANKFDSASSGWIVWDKENGKSSFADGELAYTSFDSALRIFKYMWNGVHRGRMGGDNRRREKRIHPTQKPIELYSWIYAQFAKSKHRVLDTHLGSGSSAIAAHYLRLEFVGIELDTKYFELAVERFERETRQVSIFSCSE